MVDCFNCKSPKGCIGKPWFFYAEVKFCPQQVMWIIAHRDTFIMGNWPPDPEVSSYIDPQIQTAVKSEAYFCKPAEIIGDIEDRLKTTGDSGEALEDEIKQGLRFDELSRPARSALFYISWSRKRKTFAQWKAKKKYESKVGV